MRVRTICCAFLVVMATSGLALAADPPYYLALGDSLSIGIQPLGNNGNPLPSSVGYVDDLYAFYRLHWFGLRMQKLGCSGETTTSFLSGVDSTCSYPAGSQLLQALQFLQNHRVVLITLDIGGDNLLQCFSLATGIDTTCATKAPLTVGNELAAIVSTLQAAAPQALIVGANYYDPFVGAVIFGPNGQTLAAASLVASNAFNHALELVYQALGVPVADVAGVFRINAFPANVALALTWTWMGAPPPRGPDVHPNALGYLAIASAFSKAITP